MHRLVSTSGVGQPEQPFAALFVETADPAGYVARTACEEALAQLERSLARGRGGALLVGPPGLGKTLLLRVLAAREGERRRRFVYLPYAALDIAELCAWVLGLLGAPRCADPIAALDHRAREAAAAGTPLALLVDDANSMPIATARAFGDRLRAPGAALGLVLAAPDDARTSRVAAALDLELLECRLDTPLCEAETRELLHETLRRAGADPRVWRRFSPEEVARLHGLSAGNPRRLFVLADGIARGRLPQCAQPLGEPG